MSNYTEYRGTIVQKTLETDKLEGFKGHDSDIWICGFPRSGTTLLQEITFLVNTLDFEKANVIPQPQRIRFVDCCDHRILYHEGLSACEMAEHPRMFKSHLHYFLLPEDIRAGKGKVIYVARNPGPTAISLFGLMRLFQCKEATNLQEYVELFLADKAYGCPWWLHVLQYWEHREDRNVLFLLYEDIVRDKKGAIYRIAQFLGKDLTDADVQSIIEYTDIENMRNNKMVNFSFAQQYVGTDDSKQFINTGTVDGWRSQLSDSQIQRMEDMLKHRLSHTDLKFQ